MNPLQHRLASLRHSLVLVNLWRGLCSLFAVAVEVVLVEGLADYWLHLPSVLRALCLVGAIGAALSVAILFLIVPLARRYDDLTLALKVEEVYPELNNVLGSAVQFLDQPEENLPGSKVLRHKAVELAETRAANCDFNIILDRRGVILLGIAALVVALTAGHFAYHYAKSSWTAVCRLGVPFGDNTWTTLEVPDPPHRVGRGRPFVIFGKLSGIPVSEARIDISGDIRAKGQRINIDWPAEKEEGKFVHALDMSQKPIGQFKFRIYAGDATFPAHGDPFTVDIMPPPRLVKSWPQIELTYPSYTLKSPEKLPPGQGHVKAVLGTRISWRAVIDRKVTEAWLKLDSAKGRLSFRETQTFRETKTGQRPPDSIPCQIDESETVVSVEFTPQESGTYEVHFRDADDLENEYKSELEMSIDPPPTVQLLRPTSNQILLPEAEVNFLTLVKDINFGIRSVWLEFRHKNADGAWLDKEPQRLVWFEPSPERPLELKLPEVWPLANRFKEGETVVLRVCADDYNDQAKPKLVGSSHDLELRIVGEKKLKKFLNNAFQNIQKNIVRLAIEQEAALKLVQETLTDKRCPERQAQESCGGGDEAGADPENGRHETRGRFAQGGGRPSAMDGR